MKLVSINGKNFRQCYDKSMSDGVVLTHAGLEQVAREAFIAGAYFNRFSEEDFNYYWQQRKKLLEKNVNEELGE
jgi:hypothetical protein